MSIATRLGRILAATLIGGAAGVVATGPATAASGACAQGTGVTVVVQYSGPGVTCDANGGSPAASNFTDAGHSLDYYGAGFVCRVDKAPSACTPPDADAYWGLFWSDGTSGTWTYARSGAASLKVPTGGWVAFVYQDSSTTKYPGVNPQAAATPVKPKPKPKPHKTSSPSGGGTTATPTRSATPSATPSASDSTPTSSRTKAKPSASSTPTDGASTTAQPGDGLKNVSRETGGSNSLGWVAVALAVILIAGMGAVLWRRRTAGGRTP